MRIPTEKDFIEWIGGAKFLPLFETKLLEVVIIILMIGSFFYGSLVAPLVFFVYGNIVLIIGSKLFVEMKMEEKDEQTEEIKNKVIPL